ncbi:MAG: hypothetical protein JO028_16710 [Acidobacteriaceae bacterium]|nr:hypothetical protein [Acidobacteriaceae bacterium]
MRAGSGWVAPHVGEGEVHTGTGAARRANRLAKHEALARRQTPQAALQRSPACFVANGSWSAPFALAGRGSGAPSP